jgi:hypothetical protein
MSGALLGARLHFGGEFYKRLWEMEDSFPAEVGSGYGAALIVYASFFVEDHDVSE